MNTRMNKYGVLPTIDSLLNLPKKWENNEESVELQRDNEYSLSIEEKESFPELPALSCTICTQKVLSHLPRVTFIETWDQALVFSLAVILYVLYVSWVHGMGATEYSPPMMTMAVLIIKLVVSFMSYLFFENSFSELVKTISINKRYLCLYVIPASAYATTDTLSIVCLRHMDPSGFAILYHVRVVFLLLLFQYFFKISLKRVHWIGMAFMVIACIVKELPGCLNSLKTEVDNSPPFVLKRNDGITPPIIARWQVILLVIIMAQIVSFAAVFNEKLMKDKPVSLNIQNIAMYVWALLACLIYASLFPSETNTTLTSNLTDANQWIIIWTFPVLIAAILSAVYGLVTSYFVRSLNSVVREIAGSIQIMTLLPVNAFFFGYTVLPTDYAAVLILVYGVYIYNKQPLRK